MGILEDIDVATLKEINSSLDLNDPDELEEYVDNLNQIDMQKYQEKYDSPISKYLIENYLILDIAEYNNAKYILKDEEKITSLSQNITNTLDIIKNEDWKYFINEELEEYQEALTTATSASAQKRYTALIAINEYRLKNDIPTDSTNYLHNALNAIKTDITEYCNLIYKDHKTPDEEERYTYIKEEMARNKYIIEQEKDIDNSETLRAVLTNFSDEFGLFILIFTIMISGNIVSEEFNKGTIKYLLTKPYKRHTILTSKLLCFLLSIPLVIFFMVIIELIIGGIILGFDSLSVPVIIYSSGAISSYNIFTYLFLVLGARMPIYIVLGIIAFAIGTITASSSAAITISFLFYLAGNIIANLAQTLKIKVLKYFVSLHWDFRYLIDKAPNPYHFKPYFSVGILLIYLVIIISLTYVFFNKKDVKNV